MKITKLLATASASGILVAGVAFWPASATVPGTNNMVSVDNSGNAGNSSSQSNPQLSGDGKYVVFDSQASNLVSGDTNGAADIFLRNTVTGATTRVSVSSTGAQANSGSFAPTISYDGRYIAYTSSANNLVAGDTNGVEDIFLYDTQTGATTLVSQTASGTLGDGPSSYPAISANGRYIAFETDSDNFDSSLSSGPAYQQVVVKDMQTGSIQVLSKNSSGTIANSITETPTISCDGSLVSFVSSATNLISGDASGNLNIYVADRINSNTLTDVTSGANGNSYSDAISCNGNYLTYTSAASNLTSDSLNSASNIYRYSFINGSTELVSKAADNTSGNNESQRSSISGNGRYVVFRSYATNLVSGITSSEWHIYIRDMDQNTVEIVDVNSSGTAGDGPADTPQVDDEGTVVTYTSEASNLVTSPANSSWLNEIFTSVVTH